ncbi:HNH endonuclease [Corynebacterium sp. CNCTC7651]|nr:HNH endonuclease signature motif containing protein [Corynebacterium sp. CNCTC7651]UIZ92789.1 HNH endonuclease [Corynebacterium sp. CNCTC7651]
MVTTVKLAPRFRTQRPGDAEAAAGQLARDAHWAVFSRYAQPGATVEDLELEVARIMSATRWGKGMIEQGILSHSRLQSLPLLRELQAETKVLDFSHLCAIDGVLNELGPDVTEETLQEFDVMLARTFTPTRVDQELPHRATVTKRMRDIIKRLDPSRAYDPKKRKRRTGEAADEVTFETFIAGGAARGMMQLLTNSVSAYRIKQHLLATAREHSVSMPEAAIKLLTGEIEASSRVALQIFAPRDRKAGEPAYIPGFGWTGPDDTVVLDEWLNRVNPKVVDLDEISQQTTEAYKPTPAMRAAVVARDGTCIFPGCRRPAENCQLDHRIPFDEGGATTPSNLFALCQTHHNCKTDHRAYYIRDPETGEVVWLFADGTYEIVKPDGILDQVTPTCPQWRTSLEGARRNRALSAEFHAKGHKILDDFEVDLDLGRAEQRIAALEKEYGMDFPIKATLPEVPPIPEEPDFEEPPYPDRQLHDPESLPPESNVEELLARLLYKHPGWAA